MEPLHLVGIVLILLVAILIWVLYEPKGPCKKCGNKTSSKSDDKFICSSCYDKQLIRKAQMNEKKRLCPVDGEVMDKIVIKGTDIVVDSCPGCQGKFLDDGELKKIMESVQSDCDDDFTYGLVVGLAVS